MSSNLWIYPFHWFMIFHFAIHYHLSNNRINRGTSIFEIVNKRLKFFSCLAAQNRYYHFLGI